MRIDSVHLQNIKSYVDDTVALTPGTNAIWGPNGSGKTTLLESIGFALFDFLPYGQKAFVREGEPFGTVRVQLVAPDERSYEVVRQVGKTRAHHVSDLETNQKIVEGTEHVIEWLRDNVIRSGRSEELRFLFENAIGVPQGMMTGAFRGAASQRKATFDRLLGVEEYEDTWKRLLDTENLIRTRVTQVTQKISRYQGETARLPDLEVEVAETNARVERSTAELKAKAAELERVKEILDQLDRLATAHESAQREVERARADVVRSETDLASWQERVEASQRANEIIAANKDGFEDYCRGRNQLVLLELRRKQSQDLRTTVTRLEGEALANSANATSLQGGIEVAEQSARTVAELQPLIDELTRRESELEEARRLDRDKSALEDRLAANLPKIEGLSGQLSEVNAEIDLLVVLQQDLPDVPQLENELNGLRERYAAAVAAQGRVDDLTKEKLDLTDQITKLSSLIDQATQHAGQLSELRGFAESLPDIEASERNAELERQQLEINLKYQDLARQELIRRRCPLLTVECPAAGDSDWVNLRFEERVVGLEREREGAQARHSAAVGVLAERRAALTALPALEAEAREIGRIGEQRSALTGRLGTVTTQLTELQGSVAEADALRSQGEALRGRIDVARSQEKEIASLPAVTARRADLEQQIQSTKSEVEALSGEISRLSAVTARIPELTEYIETRLVDKRRYQEALNDAARLEGQREALDRTAREAQRLAAEIERVRLELDEFTDLDRLLEEARGLQSANMEAYETYLKHKAEADYLGERREQLANQERLTKSKQDLLSEAKAVASTAQSQYDPARHADTRAEREALMQALATLAARIEADQVSAVQREKEILGLKAVMAELSGATAELEAIEQNGRDVGFLREIIRAAGPAVTESLVQNVTYNAAEIFGDIMDDHTLELQWRNDYNIVVRQGAEERPFLQLSGGEQMSAALAVRLALIKQVSEIGLAFFDEPTQNMDAQRRANLAGQIQNVAAAAGFDQLIIISHDDSFEEHTDTVVRLSKSRGRTMIA